MPHLIGTDAQILSNVVWKCADVCGATAHLQVRSCGSHHHRRDDVDWHGIACYLLGAASGTFCVWFLMDWRVRHEKAAAQQLRVAP